MELECYKICDTAPRIVAASSTREWMDLSQHKYAYRCLPMSIANAYGWDVLCPFDFQVTWNGLPYYDSISIYSDVAERNQVHALASSIFGNGVITFHTGYLFRTSPNWDLLCTGAFNYPKHGIIPLSGIIETEWLSFTFTMNWLFTEARTVYFMKDEPFCRVIPVQRGVLEPVTPMIKNLSDNPALHAEYTKWAESRGQFINRPANPNEKPSDQWQKHYFQGKHLVTGQQFPDHRTKLRLNTPEVKT